MATVLLMRTLFGVVAVAALAAAGCAGNMHVDPYAPATGGQINAGAVPDVRCAGTPATGPKRGFHHVSDRVFRAVARPDHRGYDLVTRIGEPQVISGKLAYGVVDRDLDDEEVDLFACVAGTWQPLGTTRSDDDGRFSFTIPTAQQLPIGLRDIYASVVADRSGFRMLAYVGAADTKLILTDIDGTLTAGETQFRNGVITGKRVKAHPGAAESLQAVTARGYQIVYVTARPDRFTDMTRQWLGANGFPRGPVRLTSALWLKPGAATVAYKAGVFNDLHKSFPIAAGIGNRMTDIAAYTEAGVSPDRIFVKLPEFGGEMASSLRAGAAVGFGTYGPLAVP